MTSRTFHHENNEILEWQWSSNNELMPAPFWTSCYLVDGLLIDTAAPGSVNELREFINKLGGKKRIKKCILTHAHEDHSGGAFLVQEEFDIPVYSNKKTHDIMEYAFEYPDYRKMTWGEKLHPVITKIISEKIISGNEKYEFNLLEMPGHAPGLLTLIEKQKQWVFATDAIQPKYRMIFGPSTNINEDISQIYRSLVKLYEYIKDLKNPKIFMAGKEPIIGRDFIMERIKEIKNKHKQAHKLYSQFKKKGYSERRSIKKVVKTMFGGEHFIGQFTRGGLSVQNLIKSLLEWPLE
jgi:glyoxylase-like metal-dependent hydrolase (beta-lactamase superfamily II)